MPRKKKCCKNPRNLTQIEDNLYKCYCGQYLKKSTDNIFYAIKKPESQPCNVSKEGILEYREKIKNYILENFKDKEFTMGDAYYSYHINWNKSQFGSFWWAIIYLTKKGILDYEIKKRDCGYCSTPQRGAVYQINKEYKES